MAKPNTPFFTLILGMIVALILISLGLTPLLPIDQTDDAKQAPEVNDQTIKPTESTTSYELIYKQEVRGQKDVIIKYFNQDDNATTWTLRMADYGESSIFVMKGKV